MVSQTTEIPAPKAARQSPPPLPPSKGRRRRRIWSVLLLLLAIIAIAVVAYELITRQPAVSTGGRGATMSNRAIPVQVAQARRGDMPIYLNALGTVTAYNTVTLRTRIDGQLMHVNFKEGQVVHQGDTLFEIDPRPYEQLLLQAQGQKARDQATLDNAKADVARYTAAGNAIPKQTLDTAVATVRQLGAALEVDDSQIASANLNLIYCKIPTPISGTIGLRLVDEGNMVHASDSAGLAVVTVLKPISVDFNLPQDNLPQIQKAMAAGDVVVEAWDRDLKNKLAQGTLAALDNQIDVTTAMVKLKATFANDDGSLFPNQFVNIRVLVDVRRNVVLASSAALQLGTDFTFVYVVKPASATQPAASEPAETASQPAGRGSMPEQIVKQVQVKTGQSEKGETIILDGLSAGDIVVTDGVDKLVDGSKVIARLPSATAPAGRPSRGGGDATQPSTQAQSPGRRGRGNGEPSGASNP